MCQHPILKRLETGRVVQIACGKCAECLKKKQNAWYQRSVEEARYYMKKYDCPTMHFITLTYDDDHLPKYGENENELYIGLRYSDVNSLFRTFKMHLKSKKQELEWSYMFSGENGTKYGRPHYHLLTFNLRPQDIRWLKAWWQKHYCPKSIEVVNAFEARTGEKSYQLGVVSKKCKFSPDDFKRVAKYVSKYVAKGKFDKFRDRRPLADRPRVYASRGYGSKDTEKWCLNIPAYMRKKFAVWKWSDIEILYSKVRWNNGWFDLLGKCTYTRFSDYLLDKIYYLDNNNQKVYFLRKPIYYENVKELEDDGNGNYSWVVKRKKRVIDETECSTFVHSVSHQVTKGCISNVTRGKCSLRSALLSYLQKTYDIRINSAIDELVQSGTSPREAFCIVTDREKQESEQRYNSVNQSLLNFYSQQKDNQ